MDQIGLDQIRLDQIRLDQIRLIDRQMDGQIDRWIDICREYNITQQKCDKWSCPQKGVAPPRCDGENDDIPLDGME